MRFRGDTLKLQTLLRSFVRDRAAVSAVEFAVMLPFIVTLYFGAVEFGEGYQVQYKVTETARVVTDLGSQYISIDSPTMSTILGASSQVMTPYPTTSIVVTLSEVQVAANATTGTVSWSCSLNGTARTVGSSVAIPTTLQAPSSTVYLIFGEVSYPYTPTLGYAFTGTFNMYQTSWFYPRVVSSIAGPSSC
jgi:Flp pilus assembly protein TadG